MTTERENAVGIELANEKAIDETTQRLVALRAKYEDKEAKFAVLRTENEKLFFDLRKKLNINGEQITQIQMWMDDYVSESVWPNYLVGDPKNADDPQAAKDHNAHMFDAMSDEDKDQFHKLQEQLEWCLEQESQLIVELNEAQANGKELEHETAVEQHVLSKTLRDLTERLEYLKHNRKDYVVARKEAVEEVQAKLDAEAKHRRRELEAEIKKLRAQLKQVKEKVNVQAGDLGMSENAVMEMVVDPVGLGDLLETITKNEKESEKAEAEVAEEAKKLAMQTASSSNDARRQQMLKEQTDRLQDIPASKTIGLRKKLVNELAGRTEGEVRAYKHACMQLNRMEPVGDKFKLEFDKQKQGMIHAKEMIALRAGVDTTTKRTLEVIVHDRLSENGNVLRCEIVGEFKMADIAIAIEEGTNGKMYIKTCLNADPDWPEVENNCDGVRPNRSQVINDNLDAIPTYIEYFQKIDEKIQSMPRRKDYIAAE